MVALREWKYAPILDHLDDLRRVFHKYAPEWSQIPDLINELSWLDIDELRDAADKVWGGSGSVEGTVESSFRATKNDFAYASKHLAERWKGEAYEKFAEHARRVKDAGDKAENAAQDCGKALAEYADALAVSWGDIASLGISAISIIVGTLLAIPTDGLSLLIGFLVSVFFTLIGTAIPKVIAAGIAAQELYEQIPDVDTPGGSGVDRKGWKRRNDEITG